MIAESALQSNSRSIYERQRQEACAPFEHCFVGSTNALFCVVSYQPETLPANEAILAAALRGGFVEKDTVWIRTADLEPSDLMHVIEAIDPLCIVVLDQKATEALSRAYNQPINLAECDSILGRPCAAFVDFARMLERGENKQQAWQLIKEMLTRVNEM